MFKKENYIFKKNILFEMFGSHNNILITASHYIMKPCWQLARYSGAFRWFMPTLLINFRGRVSSLFRVYISQEQVLRWMEAHFHVMVNYPCLCRNFQQLRLQYTAATLLSPFCRISALLILFCNINIFLSNKRISIATDFPLFAKIHVYNVGKPKKSECFDSRL